MKNWWKITGILSIVVMFILIIVSIINFNFKFYLLGDTVINMEVNTKYNDSGFVCSLFNKNLTKNVKIINNLNPNKLGTYYVNYTFKFIGIKIKLRRKVNVVDTQNPEIVLNGNDNVLLYVNDEYIEEGATANDNYDGDISNSIIITNNINIETEGEYQVIYSVKDSSKNENSITRNVIVKKKEIKENNYSQNYNINDPILKYIKEKNYNVSIGYYNLVTGKQYLYQENKIYYGASLIKTLDALYLYDKNMVNDDLKPYIQKAISVSDNNSHHFLVDYIGKKNLKDYGISLGAYNTLSGTDDYGSTTVKDQIVYLKKLYQLSSNNELKSYFINDYINFIKLNNNIEVMHKYGYYNQYFHDVGIVLDNEPYIIVILTLHGNENTNTKTIVNDLSNLIYKYHKGEI